MSIDDKEAFEKEYENRFSWRKERQIYNLRDLSGFAQSGGSGVFKSFPSLMCSTASNDPKDALRWSIIMLWCEAAECYIFGEFQSCILVCGSVVERSLKLEYETKQGPLSQHAKWTLGTCIINCKGIVAPEVVKLAQQMLGPRNSRTHALLEHTDPQLSIMGGKERGVEVLSTSHALIEPYRGDAKKVIKATFKILSRLYGSET
jgi:hypothetical protein